RYERVQPSRLWMESLRTWQFISSRNRVRKGIVSWFEAVFASMRMIQWCRCSMTWLFRAVCSHRGSMTFEDAQHHAAQTSRIGEFFLYSLHFNCPCFRRRLIGEGYSATLAEPHPKISRLSWTVRLAVNNATVSSAAVRACPRRRVGRYGHQ